VAGLAFCIGLPVHRVAEEYIIRQTVDSGGRDLAGEILVAGAALSLRRKTGALFTPRTGMAGAARHLKRRVPFVRKRRIGSGERQGGK
jgi:hypothetical protein